LKAKDAFYSKSPYCPRLFKALALLFVLVAVFVELSYFADRGKASELKNKKIRLANASLIPP
jgi:hypothetical protein